jgi:2-dehydropantoate 2-reductase
MAPLLGPETTIVTAMNGVPWWMFSAAEASPRARLRSLDHDGGLAHAIPRNRIVGCVLHLSASIEAPGLVRHAAGRGLILGNPDGGAQGRTTPIADALQRAGFEVTRSESIERDIWAKLLGNTSFNPLSVLTGAAADRLIADPDVHRLLAQIIDECIAIGRSIGIDTGLSAEQRIDIARPLGAFRTSMLQDWDAGRPLETDVLIDAPLEIAEGMGIPAPALRAVSGMLRLLVENRRSREKPR